MNFINRALAQITDLFRSMTPGARIASGLLLTVVVVSVAFLFNHQSSSPDAYLMGGTPFSAGQLPAMEAAFGKANLNTYQIEGTRIRVPHSQQTAYMAALADANALPRDFGDYLENELKSAGPFVSPTKQQELLKVALQRELAQIIGSMRGIERASVLYDVQAESGLNRKKLVTASVSVKPIGNQPLEEDRVQMIREVVAGAIAGLPPSGVAVADLNSDRVYPASPEGSPGTSGQDAYFALKVKYEQNYETKIREALSYIPSVNVKVNAELNTDLSQQINESKVDPKTVPIREDKKSSTVSTVGAAPGGGGQPGVNAQLPRTNAAAAVGANSGGPHNEQETTDEKSSYMFSQSQTATSKAGLTPKRVTVTVGVLSDYYESIWRQRNPAVAGAEPKKPDANALAVIEKDENTKIQRYVSQLIPIPPDVVPEVTPLVTVTTFQHIPTAPIAPPSIVDQIMVWLQQYWSTLGMMGLGMVSLVVLRSTLRSIPAAETARPETAASAAAAASGGTAGEEQAGAPVTVQTAAARLKRRAHSGPSLRDELAEIVHEDPDAAANILRNWIGSAT